MSNILIFIQAVSYFIVSFAMYLVAQISPLEWKKASVCNHDESDEHHHDLDDEMDEFHHHHSSNSLNGSEGEMADEKENLMTNRETSIITKEKLSEAESVGNCCENYSNTSTLQHNHQQDFRNVCLMSEESDLESIWINMESQRNFLIARQSGRHTQCSHRHRNLQQLQQIGSSKVSDENLDIDDDGLIGYASADAALKQVHGNNDGDEENLDSSSGCDEHTREFTTFEDDESQSIELISYVNNFSLKNAFAWTLGTLLQSTSDLVPKVLTQ